MKKYKFIHFDYFHQEVSSYVIECSLKEIQTIYETFCKQFPAEKFGFYEVK